jgi:hypothetical protein
MAKRIEGAAARPKRHTHDVVLDVSFLEGQVVPPAKLTQQIGIEANAFVQQGAEEPHGIGQLILRSRPLAAAT